DIELKASRRDRFARLFSVAAGGVEKGFEGGQWGSGRREADDVYRVVALYKKDADPKLSRRHRLQCFSDSCFPLAPEPRQGRAIRRLAQFLEGAFADLANSLAGDTHQRSDLLEGHRVGALL